MKKKTRKEYRIENAATHNITPKNAIRNDAGGIKLVAI